MIRSIILLITVGFLNYRCSSTNASSEIRAEGASILRVMQDRSSATISVFVNEGKKPVLTQVAKPDERPYLHPIIAPDGKGVLTEFRPGHHPHQTGLYWGLKLVNGRDFFMNYKSDYYRLVSANIVTAKGRQVKWQTVYELLDEKGNTTLAETANWSLKNSNGKYFLDLEWRGEAKTDITFGKFYVGGLFLRMPWNKSTAGRVINAAGQQNQEAEAQRAIWTDVGVQVDGRDDWGHMVIFDHPDNKAFPISWRVDSQLGIGPSRQIMGDWKLNKGETEIVRYRIVIYTGDMSNTELTRLWKAFICE